MTDRVGTRPQGGRFVYGLDVRGLDHVPELDPFVTGDGAVRVEVTAGDTPAIALHPLDADRSVETAGPANQWVLDRWAGTAQLTGPPLDPDLVAHPCLALVAIAFNRWAGREAFHAASFAAGGLAYGVVGPRTAGKSTLMAGLAHVGTTVLSDDVVITDGADAFAGPRCVDLRTPIPGIELSTASARLGTRYRLRLPAAPERLPLGGWIFLHWGPKVSMRPCPSSVVLARLAAWRSRRGLPTDAAVLLDIAARPAWDLVRPAEWRSFTQVTEILTNTLESAMSA